MNTDVMFSSKTDLWSTPDAFFRALDAEFHFDIDVCATKENAKCTKFYTKQQNGLAHDWTGIVWCNPPYGREIWKWVEKGYASTHAHTAETVVMLLPARTDTKWFHEWIYGKAEMRFVRGRLKFGNAKNSAPFPSMVVIWRYNGRTNKTL